MAPNAPKHAVLGFGFCVNTGGVQTAKRCWSLHKGAWSPGCLPRSLRTFHEYDGVHVVGVCAAMMTSPMAYFGRCRAADVIVLQEDEQDADESNEEDVEHLDAADSIVSEAQGTPLGTCSIQSYGCTSWHWGNAVSVVPHLSAEHSVQQGHVGSVQIF